MVAMSAGRAPPAKSRRMRRGTGTLRLGLGTRSRKGAEFRGVDDGQVVGFVREAQRGLRPNQELGILKSAEGVLEASR